MFFFLTILWIGSPVSQVNSMIKVGLAKPTTQPQFFYKGKIQFMDGNTVFKEMNSKGKFWIIRKKSNASAYCLRLMSGSTAQLNIKLKELRAREKSISYHVVKHKGNQRAYLETGKISSKSKADMLLHQHQKWGFQRASLIKLKGRNAHYVLVDKNFDRCDLGSRKLFGLKPKSGQGAITYQGREYRGTLYCRWNGSAFRVINYLPLETYLRGVVPGEMGPVVYPRLEALKAQAVAARTYALKNMGKFKKQGFDICDTPYCQVYKGVQVEHELTDQAIKETEGLVLVYDGKMIDALYTSTCGGETDPVQNVFPRKTKQPEPYLAGNSSYIESGTGWTVRLPQNRKLQACVPVQIRARLLGIASPDIEGELDTATVQSWFKDLKPVLGKLPEPLEKNVWTRMDFFDAITASAFMAASAEHQVDERDLLLYEKYADTKIDKALYFLLRYGAVLQRDLTDLDRSLSRKHALEILVRVAETFGPEIQWKRYFVDDMNKDGLLLRDWNGEYEYPLANLNLILSKDGDDWRIMEKVYLKKWDKVYLPNGSFDAGIIHCKANGWAASVDRSSPYSSWLEKKTVDELEKQARKYVKGIRGIKELKIISQAESGRVTELEIVAHSGKHRLTGLTIRRSLGIRDNLFEFLPHMERGKLKSVTFVGKGWGHGVGMSQVGAFGMALEGWDYKRILKHYYHQVEIVHRDTLKE
ncbi:MAG: hypothetical protein CR997_06985 [Acidobacteria bacterium]|nr:MAG: hypothetical protein CR997_06985 [Acidobacteriota bacterium]